MKHRNITYTVFEVAGAVVLYAMLFVPLLTVALWATWIVPRHGQRYIGVGQPK